MKKNAIIRKITPRDTKAIEIYLREIVKFPILSSSEEVSLAKRIHNGDENALQRLVSSNLRFVISVAKQYIGCGLELDDLVSVGNMGLITAAKRFDETRGFKFCSYAVWWIRQSILKAIATEGRTISLPANKVALLSKARNASTTLEQELERTPSTTEISNHLQTDTSELSCVLKASEMPVSLDAPLKDDENHTHLDYLSDTTSITDDTLMKESLHTDLEYTLSGLSPRERNIIKMSYGIDHPYQLSFNEIAIRMSMSKERVRQIHHDAIFRLRHSKNKEQLQSYL